MMKKCLLIAFVFLGILAFATPSAHAGVSVGFSFGYPYYHHHYYGCGPRYVYSYYDPYYYRPVYVERAPVVVVRDAPTYVEETRSVTTVPPVDSEPSSYRLGHDWAKDLRDDIVSRAQFVSFLKANITKSSTADYNEFRRGFIAAYGVNGEAAFTKAYQEARGNS